MTHPLNILIVHNQYHFRGGEDTVVEQDTKLLEQHGHHVYHYTRSNEELSSLSFFQKLVLPFTVFFSFKTYREIQAVILKYDIDIVHVHNTFLMTSFSAYYAAKKQNRCLIQTIHNFRLVCPNALLFRDGHICEDCLNKGLSCSIKHKCYRGSLLQTAVIAAALRGHRILHSFDLPDAYITMTKFNMLKLNSIISNDKFYFKPNYLEPENIADISLPQTPYFLYVSRVEQVKGIYTVLEAFSILKDQTLLIIGSGPDDSEVTQYIAAHHMDHVTFLGSQPHSNTVTYMKYAKALIFPSLLYEGGFPLTIIESFSVSTPVIVSNSPNISQNIQEGYNGFLFETGNSDALIAAIRRCNHTLSEVPQAKALSDNCYQCYQENYTSEAVYKRMTDIYDAALIHSKGTT